MTRLPRTIAASSYEIAIAERDRALAEARAALRAISPVLREVAAERCRQIEDEGRSSAHDDQHDKGELARAAAAYALDAGASRVGHLDVSRSIWPFDQGSFKGNGERRSLVKAAALLLAEIERIDRAAEREALR